MIPAFPPPPPARGRRPKLDARQRCCEVARPVATGAVLLLCVLALVFVRAYEVPSASMHPTLLEGDRILVILYGPFGGPPEPGDIAVLRHTPEGEAPDIFVKRVIAVGKQKIRITPGRLIVDGEVLSEPYIAEPMAYWWPTPAVLSGEEEPQMELVDGAYVVPDGYVVVLGDNRNSAEDSYFWGAVPEDELIGRAFYRYAPRERRGRLDVPPRTAVALAGESLSEIGAPSVAAPGEALSPPGATAMPVRGRAPGGTGPGVSGPGPKTPPRLEPRPSSAATP